ncbi:MAG: ABC transporter substrate-binding protein, partial [Deltaproteobacteria bacterium]|nr:ABC transporter substrate-binding protein [Deltaproteobacteria bacterium]
TNQIVKSGDVLMTLDSTTAPANIIQSIADLVSAQQALDDAILSKTSIAKAEVALTSAKSTYNDALGRFYTLNSPVGSSDYITILKSKVLTAKRDEFTLDYRLINQNGTWLVYDIVIEGVSLVSNYRTQFNKIINSDGYPELVKKLKNKTEELKAI